MALRKILFGGRAGEDVLAFVHPGADRAFGHKGRSLSSRRSPFEVVEIVVGEVHPQVRGANSEGKPVSREARRIRPGRSKRIIAVRQWDRASGEGLSSGRCPSRISDLAYSYSSKVPDASTGLATGTHECSKKVYLILPQLLADLDEGGDGFVEVLALVGG